MPAGRSLLSHPDKITIEQMICSGWTTTQIHQWLLDNEKELISEKVISDYRANYIKPKLILPASTYAKKLKQLDVKVNTLQELYNIIEIQKRRLGYYFDNETQYKSANPDTRKELEFLEKTIKDAIELEMDLGIRTKRPIEIISTENKIDLNELIDQWMLKQQGWVALRDGAEQEQE
jgi:hypothetical protein